VRLNGSLYMRIDRGGVVQNVNSGVCCSPGTAWAPPAINANARATRTRRCLRLRIMNTSPTTAQAIAAPYRFPPTYFSYRRACSVAHWSSRVVAAEPVHVKSYSRNVAEEARQSISDPEGATECPFCCILQEGSPHPPRLMHYETIDGPRGNVVLRLKLGMGAQFHVCWGKQSRIIGVR